MNDKNIFEIGADVNAEEIVQIIRQRVNSKIEQGVYSDPRIAKAEKNNLAYLRNQEGFAEFYLECLRESVNVDINDYEIVERRKCFGSLLVLVKKLIWQMLKFYTYRLWSQQNQVNSLLLSAVEMTDQRASDQIKKLEQRLAALEKISFKQ